MVKVHKLLLALLFTLVLEASDTIPSLNKNVIKGMEALSLKVMVSKSPRDLEPDMSIVVGNMYENGMPELNIKKNVAKAKTYYKSSALRGVAMGNLLLANLAIAENDIEVYISEMESVIKANDKKLSIPAGLQLSAYWLSVGNKEHSINTLRYVADRYDEPRAQFLVGWSIVSKDYTPVDMTDKDGQFYLYSACHNPRRTKEIQLQCDLYSN